MAPIVLVVVLVLAVAAAVWFAVRYFLLKHSVRQADRELREIVGSMEESRIVKMASPDSDLEALLRTVNSSLLGMRQQAVLSARHEAALRAQIESISHDLRTPLTSLQGYLALVDEKGLDDETRASLATVERKAGSLQRLVAQFYELSCLRDEGFTLELGAVDVGRLLRESVSGHYRLLDDRGLEVCLSAPQHPLWVRANADALERVLANLLGNAGKYAKAKLEVVAVEAAGAPGVLTRNSDAAVSVFAACDSAPAKACSSASTAYVTGSQVLVTFANDVERLEEDEVARLLEPFYTVDASRSHESTGLGLAISRQLVEQMGGSLCVHRALRDEVPWLVFEILLQGAGSDGVS